MKIIGQIGQAGLAILCGAAVMATEMSFEPSRAQAAFELPPGEKITNATVVARAMPDNFVPDDSAPRRLALPRCRWSFRDASHVWLAICSGAA